METKYLLKSWHSAEDMWVVSKSFKAAALFKCLKTTVTDEGYICEEIKNSFSLGNGCYSSVHIHLI
jgi:hypothetical protein